MNEDLSETLSLAHDLGHTPFGHAGEEALNDCMKNYGGFDHNIQTLRIITILENRYYDFKGLNLSIETLDGLIKHNGPIKDLTKLNKILGNNFFKKKINFALNSSLEAQIASISDDIAYNSHDLEDGLRDFHGFSISIDSPNKIEKNKNLINEYINDKLTLIVNNEKINFFIMDYSLINDVFEVYFIQNFTKKTEDIRIVNNLLIEVYSEQSNIMFLDIFGKKYYDNFTASKTEKTLLIK